MQSKNTVSLDTRVFNKGVNEVLTLAPLRRLCLQVAHGEGISPRRAASGVTRAGRQKTSTTPATATK
jgi:hypothetical protein